MFLEFYKLVMGRVLCYACLLILFDCLCKTREKEPSIVIVVSPLTAITEDHWQIMLNNPHAACMQRFKASKQRDYL